MIPKLKSLHRHSIVRYFGVALAGLCVDYALLIFSKEVLELHYLLAAVVGFMGGLVVNYLLSNRFVFSDPKIKSAKLNFGLFVLIGLVGLGLLNLMMFALVGLLGINYIVAKTIATLIVYFWNFFARKSLYRG